MVRDRSCSGLDLMDRASWCCCLASFETGYYWALENCSSGAKLVDVSYLVDRGFDVDVEYRPCRVTG